MKEGSLKNFSLYRSAISIMQRDIFVYILSIATGVVIARVLGPEILGSWVLLSIVSAYAEGFGRLKTDIASVYFLGSKKADELEIFFSTTFFALTSGLAITAILLWQVDLIESFLFQNIDVNYGEQLYFIILIIPFEFLLYNYSYFFIALEKVVLYNRIKVIQAIVNFILICGLIFILELNLWAIVIAKIISVLGALFYCIFAHEKKQFKDLIFLWNPSLNINILRYAFNFYIIGIIGNINRLTVKTISASFFNASNLAFYNQGESSGRFLNVIPNSLSTILYPRISGTEDNKQSLEISCQAFRLNLVLMSLSGVLLYIFADPLVTLLYGEAFKPTAEVLKLAIPGFVIGSSCLTLKSYFEGKGQASIIPKIQMIPVILQIPLAYYLVAEFGLYGAAISLSIGTAFYGLAVLIAFMWKFKLSFIAILPNSSDFIVLLNLLRDFYKR